MLLIRGTRVALGLLVLFCPRHSHAQKDTASSILRDTFMIEEVVVEGEKPTDEVLSQTLSVVRVEKAFLLQHQGNTLMNTLEKLPGISAIHTGVGISKPVIRGMSFNRVIVSEYGIKQEGQQWGVDHGLELDQYNVEDVEIVKGPVTLMYGSDGMAGVVNMVRPVIPREQKLKGNLLLHYRSNNGNYGSSFAMERSKNGFWAKTRVTVQDFADYRVPATEFTYNTYKLPILNNRLKNTAGKEWDYAITLGVKKQWGQSSLYISHFNQKAGFFAGAFGIPRAYELQDDGNTRNIQYPLQQIGHLKILFNTTIPIHKTRIELDLGYQRNQREERSTPHAHNQGVSRSNSLALQLLLQTYSYHLKCKYILFPSWTLTIGSNGQWQQNTKAGYEFLIPAYKSWQGGVYVLSDVAWSKQWTWLAGIRVDKAHQSVQKTYLPVFERDTDHILYFTQGSPQLDKNYMLPSFSTGLTFRPSSHWEFKYNVGSAFRFPNVAELASNGVHHGTFRHELGDSTLGPEKGILQDLSLTFSNRIMRVQAMPFYYFFQNYIYLRPSSRFSPLADAGQIYNYQQGQVEMKGLETQMEINLLKTLKHTASVEYVWNKNLDNSLPLPFTPPLSVLNELEIHKHFPKKKTKSLFASLSLHQFMGQDRVDRNEKTTAGYSLVHLSLGTTFVLGVHTIDLRFQVRNVADTKYLNNMSRYRILNLPEQGRNFQVMVEYQY